MIRAPLYGHHRHHVCHVQSPLYSQDTIYTMYSHLCTVRTPYMPCTVTSVQPGHHIYHVQSPLYSHHGHHIHHIQSPLYSQDTIYAMYSHLCTVTMDTIYTMYSHLCTVTMDTIYTIYSHLCTVRTPWLFTSCHWAGRASSTSCARGDVFLFAVFLLL